MREWDKPSETYYTCPFCLDSPQWLMEVDRDHHVRWAHPVTVPLPYPCSKCAAQFNWLGDREKHMEACHPSPPPSPYYNHGYAPSHTSIPGPGGPAWRAEGIRCPLCGFHFLPGTSGGIIDIHMRTEHGEVLDGGTPGAPLDETRFDFSQCPLCTWYYPTAHPDALDRHFMAHHPMEKVNPDLTLEEGAIFADEGKEVPPVLVVDLSDETVERFVKAYYRASGQVGAGTDGATHSLQTRRDIIRRMLELVIQDGG